MLQNIVWLRIGATTSVVAAALIAIPAHAGLFDDNEARQAILDLRVKIDNLSRQLVAAQRTILDQLNRFDQMNQQISTLHGRTENLTNELSIMQKQQKDYYTDIDTRFKKFEPQQQTVDSIQGVILPGETDAFAIALQQFRTGEFKKALASFRNFITKYPYSLYQPSAQYWLGNTFYALKDYKGSAAAWGELVKNYPQNLYAPKALLAIANNQLEQGQKTAAQKTLRQIVVQYSSSSTAQTAQIKLLQIK